MSENHQQSELIDHEAAARRNARLVALLLVAIAVIGAGVSLGLALLHPGHDGHHRGGVVGVLIPVAILVLVPGIAYPVMLRLYRRPHYSRALQYSRGRRRRVGKTLRKGQPIAPEDRPVADALVHAMRQQRSLPYLFGVIMVVYLAQALFNHGFQRWLAILLIALYVPLLSWMLWQRRTNFANYNRLEPSQEPRTAPPR